VPYTTEQMFELIADIESYGRFMPGFGRSIVTRCENNRLRVRQTVSAGPKQLSFTSEARLEPPTRIHVQALDLPAADLAIDWRLKPEGEGCRMEFTAEFRARLPFVGPVLRFWIDEIAARSFSAFTAEAKRRYG
jgi:coenzyme Q-binding protein COQ10